MPGTIQVSVLGLVDVQTASSTTSIKVAMGKIEYRTSDSGDYIFPVTRLQENLIVTLLDVNGNGILHKEIETRMIIESGFLEEKLSFNGYGNVQLKMQFVLSEEDRNRIRFLRQSALRKNHKELVGGSSFTKSKSIASDLSSLSPMQTRDTLAAASPKTTLALSQETEVKTSADREPVSSNLITWKAEVKGITEKKKKNQPSSSDVSLSKKLPEVKKLESVSLLKQEDKGLRKPEKIANRKPMRRSLSETNLSNVRKMISTFEVKVTQDTNLLMGKSQIEDVKEKAKAQSQPKSSANIEKPKERKISSDTTEICDHIVTVSREKRPLVIEHKSPEESARRSDSLSKQRIKRSSVVEVSNDEKKQSKPVRLKDSHLENARGSRLWIFPDEAKDVLQKKTEESKKANTGERGLSCRSIEKMNINNKWKNIERLKKQKSQASADSESSRGPVVHVMRALIVVGFAGLVFLTRK
ncbi:uncharacterized protein LOC111204355 [Brassica napus]|uniref:Uncharacterized protein n=1 Tax=Brassica oleracea var. oleracea TaxID=109376 RepID=A0A0D3B332_BRAOL|nr:PREDICTED: uncharacterized protein LOC106328795 isoform X2 [Brassica oleracea var. oleracea]XP_022554556.2 uncharacterized protein LOC111204355 [Brassica napus]XP_022554557.2 uncharacterized protein LOC111204355 [Brassica napus]